MASGVELPGVDLDLADLGPGLGDGREGVRFEGGRALDGLDQVGDEVGPALVGVLDLAPLGLGLLIEADERVVDARDVDGADEEHDEDDHQAADGEFLVGHWGHSPFKAIFYHTERRAGRFFDIIRRAHAPDLKRIAVLTRDCGGVNAAIRAVVRTAVAAGLEVEGVMRGYHGLIRGDFVPLDRRSVSNIIGLGGTILKTARAEEFFAEEGQRAALANLRERAIDGLVVIGGNGSLAGARVLAETLRLPRRRHPGDDRQRRPRRRLRHRRRYGRQRRAGRPGQDPRHGHLARAHLRRRGHGPEMRLDRHAGRPGGRLRGGPAAREGRAARGPLRRDQGGPGARARRAGSSSSPRAAARRPRSPRR